MKINMRKKPLPALKLNVRVLPGQIAEWKRNGKFANAERGQIIYKAAVKEIERREALAKIAQS